MTNEFSVNEFKKAIAYYIAKYDPFMEDVSDPHDFAMMVLNDWSEGGLYRECGELIIPKEWCDEHDVDYENVMDEEAFEYFEELISEYDLTKYTKFKVV